ncbi:MAG: hypothetical protein ABJB74_03340 [Gemmatimonas sp.]
MQKTVSARNSFCSLLFAALTGSVLGACNHAAVAQKVGTTTAIPAAAAAVKGHAFGDTIKHAIRVLSLNRTTEIADVFMRQPNNVIVLAVEPGHDIEVIYPSPGSGTKKKLSSNNFRFGMQRIELVAKSNATGEGPGARQAYEACMRTRSAMVRQEAARVVRDSTGRIISGGDIVVGREPPTCDLLSSVPLEAQWDRKPLPPRAPSERYLVVLTSSNKIEALDLMVRMEGLSTVASDVALTIEAIAAGIFVGVSDSYGGTWVNW